MPGSTETIVRDKRLTAADIRTDKLIRSLDKLGETVASLEEARSLSKQNADSGSLSGTGTFTGSTATGLTSSGTTLSNIPPDLTVP